MKDRPKRISIERDGEAFSVGDGGALSWRDIHNLKAQINLWNLRHENEVKKISPEMLKAILLVKRVFSGSKIENF